MWRKRGESKVMALIDEHLKKVEECLQNMLSAIEDYLQGKMDDAESCTSRTRDAGDSRFCDSGICTGLDGQQSFSDITSPA